MQTAKANHSFTFLDQAVLHLGLEELSSFERQLLILRFWENFTIEEISRLFKVSWSEVDETIENSFLKLRDFCLNHKGFSLTQEKLLA